MGLRSLPLILKMNCEHCEKEITGRAFVVGSGLYCGCCSCTVARSGPGITGREYRNEVNPFEYDAAKSQEFHLKKMEHGDYGSKNKINYKTASRWKKVFVERAQRLAHKAASVPERLWRPKRERVEHEQAVAVHDRDRRIADSTMNLRKLDAQIASEGLSDD